MRSKINWIAVRTAYVVKGWSAQQCADEFKIDPTTIKKRASKEGWTQERHHNTTQGHLVAVEESRAIVAQAAETHLEFMGWVREQIKGSEDDLAQITNPFSRVRARREIAAMAKDYVQIEREAMGRKSGEASDATVGPTKKVLEFEVVRDEEIA